MRRGEQAAHAAGYTVIPVRGHTLRMRMGALLVGDEVPDVDVRAFVRALDRADRVMTSG